MKVNIIGGGPAGTYTAYNLAKLGHEVNLYERNKKIGPPVQCTGILSDHFTEIMQPKDEFVENIVTKTRIYSPNGNFVETDIKKNYVVCRKKFDSYLASLAEKEGAKIHLNSSFKSIQITKTPEKSTLKIELNKNGKRSYSKCDKLVGADGPLSPVAKSIGLYKNRVNLIGSQIEVKMKNDNVVEFYPYLGCYAWIVPKNKDIVRIGVAAYKNPMLIFKKFVKDKIGKNYGKLTLENQSGVIPIFNPKIKAQNHNKTVFLNGDAASFVKATTGGGINQSLKAGKILANSIHKDLDYDKEWRKKLYRNLHMHLIIHKMMQKFREDDWNNLIDTFNQEDMKKILYSESRDKIVNMVTKIAIKNPKLFAYSKYFPLREIGNFI